MRAAATLLCAVAVSGQPGGPGQVPPCIQQGMGDFMGCAQQNNVDMLALASSMSGPPPSSPEDKVNMGCGMYNTLKPCWGEITTIAEGCVEPMMQAKPVLSAMVGKNFIKGLTGTTMRCLPELCEPGAAEMTMRKAHKLLRKLFRPTKGNKRQEFAEEEGAYGQEAQEADADAKLCMVGQAGAIMQCAQENNIGSQTFEQPPQPPITEATFCGLFSKVAPCVPAIQTALDHCGHKLEQELGAPDNIHPVAALNCFLQNANDGCAAGAARGESRSAVAALPKMIRMLTVEQQKDYTPAVAVLVLGLAIVGAMLFFSNRSQQKPEDHTYGSL